MRTETGQRRLVGPTLLAVFAFAAPTLTSACGQGDSIDATASEHSIATGRAAHQHLVLAEADAGKPIDAHHFRPDMSDPTSAFWIKTALSSACRATTPQRCAGGLS